MNFLTAPVRVRAVVAGLPVVLMATLLPLAGSAQADTPLPSLPASSADSAVAQAVATGTPVEVSNLTTETTQVMAQPDGTFVLTANRSPVRARHGAGWAPIDTTLSAGSDGSLSPAVTTTPVSFSGGGTGPLVRVGNAANGEVDLSWPTALPAPKISGDTATYPNVQPNVDLVLVARSDGYSESLVVKTPAAAQALVAHPLTLNATGVGVALHKNDDGSLSASDSSGRSVLSGPAPTLWDSSNRTSPLDSASALQSGNATVRGLVTSLTNSNAGSTKIALAVPSSVLSDPTTTYPLYVDPSMSSSGTTPFRTVQSGGWNYNNPSTEPFRVGYCGWAGCTSSNGNARSYFRFDTTALRGQATTAHIYDATVYADEIWNATSAASSVNLTKSGTFSTSTTYPGPYSTTLETLSSSCGAGGNNPCNLLFTNTSVAAYLQDAADGDWTNISFSLSAPAENNANYWKKFDNNPSITVKYDFPPSTPTGLDVSSKVACSGKPIYTRDNTPTVYAQANDNNPSPLNVGLDYEVWNNPVGSAVVRKNTAPVSTPQNTRTGWTTNSSNTNSTAVLPNGAYDLRVRAESMSTDTAHQFSGYSGWYAFTVDATAPSASTLGIQSFEYPRDYWGSAPSTPGHFNLSGPSDVAAFTYSFDTAGAEPLPPDTQCTYTTTTASGGMVPATSGTTTTASIPPPSGLASGYHKLYVKAFDAAHNVSGETSYAFYVSPTFSGSGANFVEAENLTPITQPAAQTNDYTFTDGPSTSWSGSHESQLVASSSASFSFPLSPPTTGYYAAGVRLTTGTHNATLGFQIDGADVLDRTGQPITQDTCSATAGSVYVPLGGVRLDSGTPHTLTVKLLSTSCADYVYNGTFGTEGIQLSNYHDNGFSAAVDTVTLAPLSGVTYSSLQAAFNNTGIATDGQKAAAFDLTSSGYALSRTALSAAGISQGSPYTIGNVTFAIPAATANGDNVVATGQTISLTDANGNGPIPGNFSNPGYVDLLVASTCGPVVPTVSKRLTMEFATGSTSVLIDSTISAVPDWVAAANSATLDPPGTTPAGTTNLVTTDHIDIGSAAQPTPATLYLMQIPIPQDYGGDQIKSVTLPRVGTDFTSSCDSTNNALHVLAMTTSGS